MARKAVRAWLTGDQNECSPTSREATGKDIAIVGHGAFAVENACS